MKRLRYRFSLISDESQFTEFTVFRKFCNNLHHVEERIKQARNLAKKAAGRKRSRAIKIAQSLKRSGSFQVWDFRDFEALPTNLHLRKSTVCRMPHQPQNWELRH